MAAVVWVCLAIALFCVAYPLYVMRPFRPQGPRELQAALAVLQYREPITITCTMAVIVAAFASGRRVFAAGTVLLACLLAWLARVNVYEQIMFHSAGRPQFVDAKEAQIDSNDKLIVVKVNGNARAYPIRMMGYHHVVNDDIGGTAIVATY